MQAALGIARDEGVDALTLARVAERSGVTKPIAYEHFGTREGLLIALIQDYDERMLAACKATLNSRGDTLQDVAAIFSASYIDACLEMGPEIAAIFNALCVGKDTQDFLRTWRAGLVDAASSVFAPFVPSKGRRDLVLTGILGAAEALSGEVMSRAVSRRRAVDTLAHIIGASLGTSSR